MRECAGVCLSLCVCMVWMLIVSNEELRANPNKAMGKVCVWCV